MKFIIKIDSDREIWDNDGMCVYRHHTHHSGLDSVHRDDVIDPSDFRDLAASTSTIGGQDVDAVEKFYNIEY